MLRRLPIFVLSLCAAALVVLVQVPFWVLFVVRRIGYAYPIDYGEGPLLRQLQFLLHGGSLAGLYGDLQAAPFVVANYPPLFLALTRLVAIALPALAAGRVVSMLAGMCVAVAIVLLVLPRERTRLMVLATVLSALSWFAIPIVREWSGVMRVDMLGVAVGLIGLVLAYRGRLTAGTVLVALALLAKPTLIAAPLALLPVLVVRPRADVFRAVGIASAVVVGIIAVLTLSGANLWLHLVQSNVNGWEYALARGFWRELLALHWPLIAVSVGACGILLRHWRLALTPASLGLTMALAYTFGGVLVGVGIGKVGAYANYFLELYAGLIWVATSLATRASAHTDRRRWGAVLVLAACSVGLVRFYPLWSETYPKPYGMIELQRPARLVIGGYGVLQDYRREGQILAANAVTNADLTRLIQQAGTSVYTDMPAIAAQADVSAPMQVFEHRQLLDVGLWDQKPLLRQLANGTIPIVVLDYLGNWMTPESIALVTTRYAQSGSRGSFDVYQPIATGAPQHIAVPFAQAMVDRLSITAPLLQAAYEPGTILPVTLRLSGTGDLQPHRITLLLRDAQGTVVARSEQQLFAGALTLADLAEGPLEHLQALSIPRRTPAGTYALALAIDDTPAIDIAQLPVAATKGIMRGEPAYLIPATFATYIATHGGEAAYGIPHMPAMSFADMTLQCYTHRCLMLPTGSTTVQPAPLGEWLRGATALLPAANADDRYHFERVIAQTGTFEDAAFATVDVPRNDGTAVIWLCRDGMLSFQDDEVTLADAGARLLRLPGIPYRWGIVP
ncbi:MAG: hypothetical protein RLY87_218 [Chloroflexota bacterium]